VLYTERFHSRASATSRLLETLLYGISRADPTTYVAVIALLGGVAAELWRPDSGT
jgi:hypothetical protein